MDQNNSGKVSYVTSNNIYVKFANTEHISIGDTLFTKANEPVLIVSNKSSTSCVCNALNRLDIKKGVIMYARFKSKTLNTKVQKTDTVNKETRLLNQVNQTKSKEKIRGRISVSSYNNVSSTRDNRFRFMSRFSMNASHINNSRFSVETYLSYRQNFIAGEQRVIQNTSPFKVYNLALRFDLDSTLSFVVGRKINSKAWSVGAVDGLQIEKHFGKNYVGTIFGFKPDIVNYNFNSNLLEYGGYIGRADRINNMSYETTIGIIEQKKQKETDRRYAFFQYSTTLYKNLNIFSSIELDLFKKLNGIKSNELRLTNLYTSVRYRMNRIINVSLSYDSRKKILYYETYHSEIEQMLDDDIARQGIRARINLRPIKYITGGFSFSKRFQSDNQNKSDNLYGYLAFSKLPSIGGRLIISYNLNESNYLKSRILAFRHARSLIKNKLQASFYYRFVTYEYFNNDSQSEQNYFGTTISFNFTRKLLMNVSGEMSQLNKENNYRIYTKLLKRF